MNWFLDKASKGIGKLTRIMYDEEEPLHNSVGKPLAYLADYLANEEEKDNKLKEENTTLWAGKKLLKGTIKGILGSSLSSNK